MTAERLLFSSAVLRVSPPWLQRLVGAPVMQGLADPLDTLVERSVAAVKARFPNANDEDALARIGRERRIRQGLSESAATYITRILPWWDVHRVRGNAYALLGQLDAYFQSWLNVQMDVVSNLGNRHSVDDAAALADSVITHDDITWGGDESGKWARFWVFFYLPGDTFQSPVGTLDVSALSDSESEIFACIPREWSAAHVDEINVVLLWADRRLWNYPQPVPTWADWGSTSDWGEPPAVITIRDN